MGQSAPILSFSGACLTPVYDSEHAHELPVNLAPSTTFPQGQLLALAGSLANDVQTITISGSPAGGTWTLTVTNPITGAAVTLTALAYNIPTATLQAALRASTALGAGNVVVTGTAGTSYVLTAAGNLAGMPLVVATASGAGLTGGTSPAVAVAHTTTGRSANTYIPYAGATGAPATAPTVAGNGSGSSLLAGTYDVQYTLVNANGGETTASPPASTTITANQNLRVSAITVPTGTVAVNYYVDGALLGTTAASGTTAAQTDLTGAVPAGGSRGLPQASSTSGRATCALKYAGVTDAAGMITVGPGVTVNGGEWGQKVPYLPAYFSGIFASSDLVGIDAQAVESLGRMWNDVTLRIV